jgi:predicted amidophosphoribosyltransferase
MMLFYIERNIRKRNQKRIIGRSENIENIFDVIFTEENQNKHFLIVDDVLTTGATLEACSKALLKIPGAKISIVCMAMANS